MFLRGSFSRGNYVGDKSSEMHSGAVSWGILPGVYPWDNFPGAIIQGAVIRGAIFLEGNCPRTDKAFIGSFQQKLEFIQHLQL